MRLWAIYRFEMARAIRTVLQSLVTPVITTSLYFVVFGAAIGSRMSHVDGVPYGAFIVPGLIMLSIFTESMSNASFGIYLPKFTGTIYELLSAPVSFAEVILAFVGAAATKSVVLGLVILATAECFVPIHILHPLAMLAFLVLTAASFSLFGFISGILAKSFDQLQFVPMLVITPLTFLGGAFYSVVDAAGGVAHGSRSSTRWFISSAASAGRSTASRMSAWASASARSSAFFLACLAFVAWIFKTGYRLKS